jgi:hypothetical protein
MDTALDISLRVLTSNLFFIKKRGCYVMSLTLSTLCTSEPVYDIRVLIVLTNHIYIRISAIL